MTDEGVENEKDEEELTGFFGDPVIRLILVVAVLGGLIIGGGFYLYAASGVWPPLVAIESGSMEPNIMQGDVVFIVNHTNPSEGAGGLDRHGVVTREVGESVGYERFGDHGDAIVFSPDGDENRTSVIHRAEFYVEEGDEWTNMDGEIEVAPHDGFVTKGDANDYYDQAGEGISEVVRPEWLEAKGQSRVPYIGRVRLVFGWVSDDMTAGIESVNIAPETPER